MTCSIKSPSSIVKSPFSPIQSPVTDLHRRGKPIISLYDYGETSSFPHLFWYVYQRIWGFPKIAAPLVIIHFHGIFPYKPTILGYPHLWKPAYRDKISTKTQQKFPARSSPNPWRRGKWRSYRGSPRCLRGRRLENRSPADFGDSGSWGFWISIIYIHGIYLTCDLVSSIDCLSSMYIHIYTRLLYGILSAMCMCMCMCMCIYIYI